MRAVVYASHPEERDLGLRTVRALRLLGLAAVDLSHERWPVVLQWMREPREAVWLVRAGAWPEGRGPFAAPPPSVTGRPLLAFGGVASTDSRNGGEETRAAQAWRAIMESCGGAFRPDLLPEPVSVWLESRVVDALDPSRPLTDALGDVTQRIGARIVHYPGLDVRDDEALRIAEVVTSAQQGGAERIALDLARGLRHHGLRSCLVTLGRPTRASFDTPGDALDLSGLGGPDPAHRARRVARELVAEGFDLVHGHLLDQVTVQALAARDLPVVLTVHNTKASWPRGTTKLSAADVSLLIGCAQVVEEELRDALPAIRSRTVWNGVDFDALKADLEVTRRSQEWRESLGLSPEDFVLLSLANARPQKRLHLLPGVLRATRDALAAGGTGREARLVIAGAPSAGSPVGQRAIRRLEDAIDASAVRAHVRQIGSVNDVAACLAGSDVLVSTSAHEGLSLAQIETLAAGRPIVVTRVGGASELAVCNPGVFLLDADATPHDFARALIPLAPGPRPQGREPAQRHFDSARMVEGYARLLPRALRAARRTSVGEGVWLVTNNFSTGGAQTSARRLLSGLRAEGVRVRAAVVEEQVAYPTQGRLALEAEGVSVLAIPGPQDMDAAKAVALLLDAIDRDPPQAVLLWNVMPEHKVLIADSLLDIPLYDVSPGEMYFSSLERWFDRGRAGLPYRSLRDYGRRLAGVIVKYEGERERARTCLGAPVHVIPNGVPLDEESPRERPKGGPLVIGTAVRLDPRKHVDRLLRALRLAHLRLPPYVLKIAGGPERGFEAYADELRSLAVGLCVEFVGEISTSGDFLKGLDLFALVAEPAGCPNASLEAMAQGLPVIATYPAGISEQVQDGVTGRLVGREDEAGFADALVQLCLDPRLRSAMGEAGRARARSRFSMAAMVRRYTQLWAKAPR